MTDAVGDGASTSATIHAIVEQVTGVSAGPDESFFDLGLDSIQLMRVCTLVNEAFGEVIDLAVLFENPTVASCAAVVAVQLVA